MHSILFFNYLVATYKDCVTLIFKLTNIYYNYCIPGYIYFSYKLLTFNCSALVSLMCVSMNPLNQGIL